MNARCRSSFAQRILYVMPNKKTRAAGNGYLPIANRRYRDRRGRRERRGATAEKEGPKKSDLREGFVNVVEFSSMPSLNSRRKILLAVGMLALVIVAFFPLTRSPSNWKLVS